MFHCSSSPQTVLLHANAYRFYGLPLLKWDDNGMNRKNQLTELAVGYHAADKKLLSNKPLVSLPFIHV